MENEIFFDSSRVSYNVQLNRHFDFTHSSSLNHGNSSEWLLAIELRPRSYLTLEKDVTDVVKVFLGMLLSYRWKQLKFIVWVLDWWARVSIRLNYYLHKPSKPNDTFVFTVRVSTRCHMIKTDKKINCRYRVLTFCDFSRWMILLNILLVSFRFTPHTVGPKCSLMGFFEKKKNLIVNGLMSVPPS